MNCGRSGEGDQLPRCLWTAHDFRQVGIDPIAVVVEQLMKVVIKVDVVNVLVVSNREGGNRILVRLRSTRFSCQVFITPACPVIEKLMHMVGLARKVVDMLLVVGRCQNGRDLRENIRLGSAKVLVYPGRAVVGKLMDVLAKGGQGGECNQSP